MIRNKTTGLFSTGGAMPGFSKKGKMWTSTNSFSGHLALFDNERMIRHYSDCEFVTYELNEIATQDVAETIIRNDRKEKLRAEFGRAFSDFIDSLDKRNKLDVFPWIVRVVGSRFTGAVDAGATAIKLNKIKKQNYASMQSNYAFASKQDAMMFRLSVGMDTIAFDTKTFTDWQIE
jgi:hypothetical protein